MTSPFANHDYVRMNGIGNEILIVDLRHAACAMDAANARAIGRGEGLHFDQMMVLNPPRTSGTETFITIYNIDGSLATACGNGTRCVAYWLMRQDTRRTLVVETGAGLLHCTRTGEHEFSVDMGEPRLGWADIPLREATDDTNAVDLQVESGPAKGLPKPSCVNMGNPHAVFFVDDAAAWNLRQIGPLLEHHPMFPQKANISLASILSAQHILLHVWERGTGITRACGSAACATLVAAARAGFTGRTARITLPGGDLMIEWRADNHVLMTGAVELEREGRFDPALFEGVMA